MNEEEYKTIEALSETLDSMHQTNQALIKKYEAQSALLEEMAEALEWYGEMYYTDMQGVRGAAKDRGEKAQQVLTKYNQHKGT